MKKIIYIILALLFFLMIASQSNNIVNIKGGTYLGEIEGKYKIYDRTEACAEMLEPIFKDETHNYYLSCLKSETIILADDKGNEITLRYAIDNNLVTIEELLKTDIVIYKYDIEK